MRTGSHPANAILQQSHRYSPEVRAEQLRAKKELQNHYKEQETRPAIEIKDGL